MVETTGENGTQKLKIIIDSSVCSEALQTAFKVRNISFQAVETHKQLSAMLTKSDVDAIIFGQTVQPTGEIETKAAKLGMITGDVAVPDDFFTTLDCILPTEPNALIFQLRKATQAHREKLLMEQKLSELADDVEHRKLKILEIELLKNAIVRNVSHELRTPLLQVKSAVALIAEDPEDKKIVNYAQNAVARLETHVKNITMLGHSLDTNLNPIILRDAVEYAKRNLTRIWTRRTDAQRVQVNIEPNLAPVMADKQGLSTVLQLLIDNALKFGSDKNIEVIGRSAGDDYVYVAIRDEGIGIASDKLQDIFQSFYQVDDTSTRPYGGAGVGLALVKLILENHHVEIHVESVLNEGSTFWFEIPIAKFDD